MQNTIKNIFNLHSNMTAMFGSRKIEKKYKRKKIKRKNEKKRKG